MAICLAAYNIYIIYVLHILHILLYIYALMASFGSASMRVLGQSVIITPKYRKIEKFCQGCVNFFLKIPKILHICQYVQTS
jgi:hypothetical protein